MTLEYFYSRELIKPGQTLNVQTLKLTNTLCYYLGVAKITNNAKDDSFVLHLFARHSSVKPRVFGTNLFFDQDKVPKEFQAVYDFILNHNHSIKTMLEKLGCQVAWLKEPSEPNSGTLINGKDILSYPATIELTDLLKNLSNEITN